MKRKEIIEPKPKKNIFNVPSEEAKKYMSSIIKDVKTIMDNDRYMEAMKKVKLPDDATIKDYENLVKRIAPNKFYNFLALFFDDCFDELRRILGAIFLTDFEEYKNKSLDEMFQDILTLSDNQLIKIISFFHH